MDKETAEKLSVTEILNNLGSSEAGLTEEKVLENARKFGLNELKKSKNSALEILLNQFKNSIIYLLVVASAVSFLLKDFSDGIVIAVIFLINAGLGFFQEYRSEKAVEKLSKLISKKIYVKRNGRPFLIDEIELVIGDVVLFKEGDNVPADIKLISAENLQVDESQLTGESIPVHKTVGAGDGSLLFTGSTIEKGEAIGIIYVSGDDTQLGKIASLTRSTRKETQYEKSLNSFSQFLIRITLFSLALLFLTKLLITRDFSEVPVSLVFIIGLAVVVVPEALPVIATLTLSQGALKLAKKHVVVKRLSALEDLGNVNLLCTDKTGTLTENKMKIEGIVSPDINLFQKLAFASREDLDEKRKGIRNSYDQTFSDYLSEDIKKEALTLARIKEIPFDPRERRSRVIVQDTVSKKKLLIVVGAVETLLEFSVTPKKKEYLEKIAEDGFKGIRHLGIAYKEIKSTESDIRDLEKGLNFLGFAQFTDPLRSTAKRTVEIAKSLGISIKILSGDSKEVSGYIGSQLGLLREGEKVFTGGEIEQLSTQQLKLVAEKNNVFARVTPEQKYSIIKVLKEGNVVAYQGDGINDAPSLKLADVGIAVNTATDVAKESAEILLLRKDIEVIVNGIKYGREIFVNINKYIKYTMVGNFGNYIALGGLYLISLNLPLLTVQLLLTSLITDLPLIAISTDNVDPEEIKKPEQYNMQSLMFLSLTLGLLTALFEFIFFSITKLTQSNVTQTSLFLFLTFIQLAVIFSIRNTGHFWKGRKPSNQILVSIVLVFILALALPFLPITAKFFSFSKPPESLVTLMLILMVIYVFVLDVAKIWYYRFIDRKHKLLVVH